MIPRSVKAPTITNPFHKLPKVVAGGRIRFRGP
jgi:hypothetical protein